MLTSAQERALLAICDAGRAGLSPAQIGYALTPDRKPPLRPQGAGRLGGTMGTRLKTMGLVWGGGFPTTYTVLRPGRALAEKLREEG